MRKYLVLTSILALSACGGGGGSGDFAGHAGHPTTPTNPTVNMQGFNGGAQVNANNTGLTNMASYTVDYSAGHNENDAKAAMINYVDWHLRTLRGDLNRSASSRESNRDGFTPEQFANADAAIAEMKQVLYDMVGKPNDAALKTYVARYRYAVVNALKLQDVAVTNETSIDDLVAAFNTLKGTKGWTAENIIANLDAFDQEHFYIVKHRMETDVKLHSAGDANAYFQFDLDAGGAITRVAMFEGDAPNDYGWFDKNNNPNGNQFVKTVYGYRFTMGNLATAVNGLTETQIAAFTWFNGVTGKDDITNLRFNNDSDGDTLSNADKKAAMKRAINAEIDDFKSGQHDHDHDADIELVRARYLALIDAAFADLEDEGHNTVFAQHITPLDLTVTMVGEGKTLGLQYSDFGYVDLKDMHEKTDGTFKESHTYAPYAGGYDARTVTPEEDAEFTGTAVAGIQWSSQDFNGDQDGDGMLVRNENAQLTFDQSTGISTLVMNNLVNDSGKKWYNVTVSGDFSGEHASDLTFTFDAAGKNTASEYDFLYTPGTDGTVAFAAGEWNATKNEFKQTSDLHDNVDYRGNAGVDYYGTSVPSEVTATFSFSEEQHIDDGLGNESHHEVAIYGAYGGH